ncbi:MAG: Cu(I)-responsive transcriptional regulator [Candidatus Pelagadaptatus aseana]|uniref:MerR family transcriptional regulator n=1 Tax=Candidatus Pelagadaptatus aseana TaxID=3120508 RepID=UPI0039B247E4
MNISQAAKISGLPAQTVRYYESIGLVSPARMAHNGYRSFSKSDVDRLCFLKQAKTTGFSLEESRDLLALYENADRRSQHVKQLVLDKLSRLDQQIEELMAMRQTLSELAEGCQGDEQPNCHIINQLAEQGGAGHE